MKFSEKGPSQKYSPEQKERIKYLLDITSKDLNSPSIIGYHGAGFKTIDLLIKTGKLFGGPIKSSMADSHGIGNKGDLHFFPRAKGFPQNFDESHLETSLKDLTQKDAIEGAKEYAELLSERDTFMEIAGLDILNSEHHDLFYEFSIGINRGIEERINQVYEHPEAFKKVLEVARKLKLDKAKITKILLQVQKETLSRNGLILGLDKKLLERYGVRSGDDDNDLFINCPDGLDYRLLTGLRPLGKKEKEFLNSLKP